MNGIIIGLLLQFWYFLIFPVAAHSYELNNLDNDALDAPVYNSMAPSHGKLIGQQHGDDSMQDFTSLPCETFLVACRTENDLRSDGGSFHHKNPLYQSAHVQLPSSMECNDVNQSAKADGKCSRNSNCIHPAQVHFNLMSRKKIQYHQRIMFWSMNLSKGHLVSI